MGSGRGAIRRVRAVPQTVASPGIVKTKVSQLNEEEIAVCRSLTLRNSGYMASRLAEAAGEYSTGFGGNVTGVAFRIFSPEGSLRAWAMLLDEHDGEPLEMHVYVRASERRKGLGGQLVKAAVASTRREIKVEASDEAAYELYKGAVYSHKRVFFGDDMSPYSYPEMQEEKIYAALEEACESVLSGAEAAAVELGDIDGVDKIAVLEIMESMRGDYSFRHKVKKRTVEGETDRYLFTLLPA